MSEAGVLDSAAGESGNARAYSVSELSFALKRTLEDAYGFVRLRGEISKVTRHSSGHVYLSLKDDKACIDGVVWKTSVRALKAQPAMGLEVIVTGRITTYPGRSQYQIIIETLEPAGVGALLAQLERLKAKLAAEGLFAPERKRPLPASPAVVGVITSPTGAVIRDILHRLRDRWPCRVLVWPVVVQGDAAAGQVAAAIRGFCALGADGALPRPDVLIVARGGGSVEDLWAFNDEALARTAAACTIPLISAVGHETDTTLIDFVSDRRAPTPTAAAEMATPVFADLQGAAADLGRRLHRCAGRSLEERRTRLAAAARGLPKPQDLLALAEQRLDLAAGGLRAGLRHHLQAHAHGYAAAAARLTPALLERPLAVKGERLERLAERLDRAGVRTAAEAARRARLPELSARLDRATDARLDRAARAAAAAGQLLGSLNPEAPLARGFALVRDGAGRLVRRADAVAGGEALTLRFADGEVAAVAGGAPPRPKPRPRAAAAGAPQQPTLL